MQSLTVTIKSYIIPRHCSWLYRYDQNYRNCCKFVVTISKSKGNKSNSCCIEKVLSFFFPEQRAYEVIYFIKIYSGKKNEIPFAPKFPRSCVSKRLHKVAWKKLRCVLLPPELWPRWGQLSPIQNRTHHSPIINQVLINWSIICITYWVTVPLITPAHLLVESPIQNRTSFVNNRSSTN